MARVLIATQAWGWITDQYGNGRPAIPVSLATPAGAAVTVYDAVTGGAAIPSLATAADGTIPGYVESGPYDLTATIPNPPGAPVPTTRRVEAAAGVPEVLAAATDVVSRSRVAGDVQDRYQRLADGTIKRGPGGSTPPSVESGAALRATADTDGGPLIDTASPWGINADGEPYYDPAGAVSGEEAVLTLDAAGVPTLTTLGG
jgi:hypothetical protein